MPLLPSYRRCGGFDKRVHRCGRFVLENSGVAEPQNIRDKFSEAIATGHPLMARMQLDTMVTIVDSSSFIKDYASRVALAARPDLGEGGNLRPVVDLLVEQIECGPAHVDQSRQELGNTVLLSPKLIFSGAFGGTDGASACPGCHVMPWQQGSTDHA